MRTSAAPDISRRSSLMATTRSGMCRISFSERVRLTPAPIDYREQSPAIDQWFPHARPVWRANTRPVLPPADSAVLASASSPWQMGAVTEGALAQQSPQRFLRLQVPESGK